jgi:PleD family two-component response regulator
LVGVHEARRYITELRRRQQDPLLWPDFLTGLPDETAVARVIHDVYPKLQDFSITIIRIANIQPYLVKYGSGRHREIIEWTAAILKTTMDRHQGFVGKFRMHDFIAVCETKKLEKFLAEATRTFETKMKAFYTTEAMKEKKLFSFTRFGKEVSFGLMKLIFCSVNGEHNIPKENVIEYLLKNCPDTEGQAGVKG